MPTDPATVPPLTEQEIEALWNGARGILKEWREYPWNDFEKPMLGKVARAAYALAASRVDTAEVERRAARKALAECAAWLGKGESQPVRFDEDGRFLLAFERVNAFSDRYIAREYPAPAPRECVPTLADLVEECNATKSDDGRPFERAVVAALDAIAVRVARLAAEVGQ